MLKPVEIVQYMIIFFVLYILLLKYIYFTIQKEDFTLDFLRFFTYQDARCPKLALSMGQGVSGPLMFKTCEPDPLMSKTYLILGVSRFKVL